MKTLSGILQEGLRRWYVMAALCMGGALISVGLVCWWVGLFMGKSPVKAIRRGGDAPLSVASEVKIGDLYALVVGVSRYKHPGIPQLNVAHKDAMDFDAFLAGQTGLFQEVHRKLLINEDASRSAVHSALHYWLLKAGADDTVVVFLSGHGTDDRVSPGDYYFLTYDSDPQYIASTAIHMNRDSVLANLECKRVVLFADACHAGGFSAGGTKAIVRSHERFRRMFQDCEGKLCISSCKANEFSRELPQVGNSVFTYYLLRALQGEGDINHDSIVTLQEAYSYLYDCTKDETHGGQHPQIAGQIVGNFPLAALRSAPSIPQAGPGGELETLHAEALSGRASSQYRLGYHYEYGLKVQRDLSRALLWYRKAAAQGHEDAIKAAERLSSSAQQPEGSEPSRQRSRVISSGNADPKMDVAFLTAVSQGEYGDVRVLLTKGANVNAKDRDGKTALMYASAGGRKDIVEMLLADGANVNEQDSKSARTALMEAAQEGRSQIVKMLLSKSADVDAATHPYEWSPLMMAAKEGHTDVARLLLDNGANVNARDSTGTTALLHAVKRGKTEMAKLLLQRGANCTLGDYDRDLTPLMAAALTGNAEAAQEILNFGADVNARNTMGETALIVAAQEGHTAVAKLFLAHGADATAEDEHGKNALWYANFKNHGHMTNLLQEYHFR